MNNEEKILALLEQLQQGQNATNARLDLLEERVSSESRQTRTLVENEHTKIRNLLQEEYGPVAQRVRDTEAKLKNYDELEATVTEHEEALVDHNERLVMIEQAI